MEEKWGKCKGNGKGGKWCGWLQVWKMKENIVVFEDGGNDNVVGWRGASTITMDWNGREERLYIYRRNKK